MTPEEFRAAGHALIDWIADHRSTIEERPVRAAVQPGDVRRSLPSQPPTSVESIDALLADLDSVIVPGTTMVQHPMHFGWFPSNAALSSVLGDIASSGLGGLGISWESGPALTEVEEVVCDWLRQLTGLSDSWRGVINDTASTATLTAVMVARERATELSQNAGGLQAASEPIVVYSTEQAHSSVVKAALLAGLGFDNIRMVATDPVTFAMEPAALRVAMAADVAAGRVPAAIVASVGSTGVTAMDPVREIVEIAAEHHAWVHVDAAMAGSVMLLPECRHLWDGIDGADSVSWNPHKWMGTILDCSLLYFRDVEMLNRVMSTNPSYLRSPDDGEATQYRDWGIPLGRRFRAMKLWFHLRLDGVESIRARLRRDLDNAQWLEQEVRAVGDPWSVVAPVPLQTVCMRHEPTGMLPEAVDEHTLRWVQEINASGDAFLSPAMIDGRWMVRVSIGVESTERRHVAAVWQLIQDAADRSAATVAPLG